MYPSSHFALRAWLGNCFVQDVLNNSEIVEANLLLIYHGNDASWENVKYVTTYYIVQRQIQELYFVQITIEGNYSYSVPITTTSPMPEDTSLVTSESRSETTPLLTTTPAPQSAFVVTMAVSMPLLLSEFDDSRQALFKNAIAVVAAVPSSDVSISKIESITSTVLAVRRRLLSGGIRVDLSINAATRGAATQLGTRLSNPTALNAQLQVAGLPSATMLQVPTTTATVMPPSTHAQRDDIMARTYVIGAVVGGVTLVVIFIIILMFVLQDRPTIGPSYEQQVPMMPEMVIPVHHEQAYYPLHPNQERVLNVPWHE